MRLLYVAQKDPRGVRVPNEKTRVPPPPEAFWRGIREDNQVTLYIPFSSIPLVAETQWPPQAQDPPLPGTHTAAESPFLIRILPHCHVFVSASVIVFTYVCKQVLINVKKWTSDPTDVDISSWVTHWETCVPPRPAAGRVLDHHC